MFLRRILPVFLLLTFLSCHSKRDELVEGFFEKNDNPADTSKLTFSFLIDSLSYRNVNKLVEDITEYNELHSSGVGYSGVQTEQYTRYINLAKFASEAELIHFTDHQNPVVRVYAFRALIERGSPAVIPVFKKHLGDKEELESLGGCIQLTTTVNRCMLGSLQPYDGRKSVSLSKKDFKRYLKLITGSDHKRYLYW